MRPTLIIMAAGMGSRYGSLKQMDGVGPSGETLMDYSIYDALEAGFGNVVFVIRKDFMDQFKQLCAKQYGNNFPYDFVTQDLDKLPVGMVPTPGRTKPWGTGHALWVTAEKVDKPFAIINADDFYGKDAFCVLADFLKQQNENSGSYAMAGYRLENTLSPSGPVSRGICSRNQEGLLTSVTEHYGIQKESNGTIVSHTVLSDGTKEYHQPAADALCSMNCWGFLPDIYEKTTQRIRQFLTQYRSDLSSEYHLPTLVNEVIQAEEGTCRVLETTAQWFGVTYKEDRPEVVDRLAALHKSGAYPTLLFL